MNSRKGTLMEVSRIEGEVCKTTRTLWEEVFYEDSVQFTDYYFENKATKNIGYVIGQAPYDAMMFRTPYTLQIGKVQKEISYIVGVATRKECRHRGCMRELLMDSFRDMYQEKNPFTFLMPANPAIYEPFDFKYIYERDVWELKEPGRVVSILESLTFQEKECELRAAEFIYDDQMENEVKSEPIVAECSNSGLGKYGINNELNGLYSVRNLQKQFQRFPILKLLAEFANQYLKKNYNIYVHRDTAYYEKQLKESEAQNGDIYVLFEQGEIKAFFLYAKEGEEIFIQEVIEEKEGMLDFLQEVEKKQPIIMARIIHLEEMMKLVCSKEKKTVVIEIEDELIPENAGVYKWEITPDGSRVIRIEKKRVASPKASQPESKKENIIKEKSGKGYENIDTEPEVSMHIRDFASWVLSGVFINEIV